MTQLIAVAFKIERVRDGYFVPILIDANGYEFFRSNTCACADQAAACATHGGTRPLRYDGMRGMRAGQFETIDDRRCHVSRSDWGWQHHGWTHGMLKRMERTSA